MALVHERKPLPVGKTRRDRLTVAARKLRLVVEKIELRGATRHEQMNHPLRLRNEVRQTGKARHSQGPAGPFPRAASLAGKQGPKRHRPDANPAPGKSAPLVIATGYELCRIPSIDPQLHDIPMDWLVTERGLYRREAGRLVFQDLP